MKLNINENIEIRLEEEELLCVRCGLTFLKSELIDDSCPYCSCEKWCDVKELS